MKKDYDSHSLTPIGITNFRSTNQPFGIKDKDRLAHIFCIGKTGVGKSTLLQNMAVSDINKGKGLCVIDPHGDVAEYLLKKIPEYRKQDLIYLDPADLDHTIAFNPLHGVHPNYHYLVASGLVSVFKKLFSDSWGYRMEYIMRFAFMTLLEYPDATLLDIQPLLTDTLQRDKILEYVKNEATINFWKNEFLKYPATLKAEAIAPILNKTGLFLTNIPLRNLVGQKTNSFRMQQVLDGSKILLCNLSKGKIGEDACTLLGSMIVTFIQLAALYRARIPQHTRKPFFLYIDESQTFVTTSFSDMLAECRKYGLGVFMANQFLDQLHEKIRAAIFGNCGTIISFRVGATDAEILAKEFYPVFEAIDLVHLPRYSTYLKLMINGTTSQPFSAITNKL
ncbi:MAG: type IV secretion system DNA-binding domain-containing protein [Bacteroidetes bacterium]|uniref:type IV secretory system conjugative DNA transfer family protein n=1 Tax=uncultured Dysgonomonas sp. TaxID=206096 RepID=UPI001ACFF423|nr:type IV secretion system DNA-binding domain-containing protein [uncultured Dysgonomonas sp.]MBN9483125.1 type IV secretion system DNA-binding domain-containing protein [Bacteroidota bacterium]